MACCGVVINKELERYGKRGCGQILVLSLHCLNRQRKTTKNLGLGQESNPAPPEYDPRRLPLHQPIN
jgi:hypothetical protein